MINPFSISLSVL